MDNELQKLHQLELLLADKLVRICKKYNLPIFMLAGTALGAIRHRGFIPWDDDMDFGMLRSDFEEFKNICNIELDKSRFFLQSDENDKFYPFNFVKIRLNGTSVLEEFSQKADVHTGIYIDIFPIDNISLNPVKRFFQLIGFWFFRNLLWIKCGCGEDDRKQEIRYRVGSIFSSFFSIYFLKKAKNYFITLVKNEDADYVIVSDGSYGLTKETFPKKWLQESDVYMFEDRLFTSFQNIDIYLKYLYGDYMQLPPESSRNHYKRLNVNFGIYGENKNGV